jgi:secreted trypsin-like serine protease
LGGLVRRVLLTLSALVLLMGIAVPVGAITGNGRLDDDDHPYVGLSVHDVGGGPSHRCSGSFIDAHTFVTAGHCTFETSGGRVWLESDVESGIPGNGYPFSGGTGIEADHGYTHPMYDDAGFFLYDVGVLKFEDAVDIDRYASLPGLDEMDTAGKGRNNSNATVTAVGYGLQNANKNHTQADRIRMAAELMIVNVNGVAGIGPINPGQSAALSGDQKHGGTCFGDSGGPILKYGSDTIWMVNSFGLNGNCAGIGGGYRIDRQDDQDFLNNIEGTGTMEF